MASRDRRNPNFAGGDLTLTQVSERLVKIGHTVTYLCTGFKGAKKTEQIRGVKVIRIGNLWTTSILAFLFYVKNRRTLHFVIEEVIGGLRVPYLAPLYIRKPMTAVWYQRNERIFRFQYNRAISRVLGLLEFALAKIHRTEYVLCPSTRSRRDLLMLGLRPPLTRVYTPGIDDMFLDPTHETFEGKREDLVVWMGKIRRYKCTHHAVLVLENLRRTTPSSRLLIAGYPEDRKYLADIRALCESYDLNGAVSFKFRLTEDEKRKIFLGAKAVLVTSPIEGFGNVVSEANACGTPAVVSEGVPIDTVDDGVNGFRSSFGDFVAMADALRRLFTEDQTFAKLSRASRECARGRSWDMTTEVFLRTMKDAMEE